MIVALFIQITVFICYIGLTALLLLISYIWFKKLLLDPIQYLIETSPKTQKGNIMKPGHLDDHIFNLDAIVMVEPYDDGGLGIELEKDIQLDESAPLHDITLAYRDNSYDYSPDAVYGLVRKKFAGEDLSEN